MPSELNKLRVIDPILTNIVRGYQNNGLIGDNLFPVVQVEKEAGKIPLFGKEAFLLKNTQRAIRADSNQTKGATINTTPFALEEHDLEIPMDYREIAESMLPLETYNAESVMNSLLLAKEKAQADIAQDENTYPNTNKDTILDNFFNENDIDWIEKIGNYVSDLKKIILNAPNTLVLPESVWAKLKHHVKLKSYLTTIPTLQNTVPTISRLAEVLEIDNILIGNAKYTADEQTFEDIWGNNIILAYVTPPTPLGRNVYQPCFGYTLRKKGFPNSDKYQEGGGKIQKVRATDLYTVKVVGPESGFLIKNPIDPTVYAGE